MSNNNHYDPSTFTYGSELEVSDVRRDLVIPEHLGRWEHSECDIVNTMPPYRGVAADPLGTDPVVGGEINLVPTRGFMPLVAKEDELIRWLQDRGEVRMGPTAHDHVHVGVPGLTDDIDAMKRLARYVFRNQADMIRICGRYQEYPDMDAKARRYFKLDGGLQVPEYIVKNIEEKAEVFSDFTQMHCCGKDGVSRGRPFRYSINMYSLKHLGTIEFRMFRGTLDHNLRRRHREACCHFLDAALNNGPTFVDMGFLPDGFAPMQWDRELWDGLQKTRWVKDRGKKERMRVEVP